ncbi:MAPEG family protein [Rhodalgimonas zhirmunskyi]|uniref:MAPEG family protein n=1 Tax=Rhodalgimonas zhirmunskyi TaxID=2964767 RepID=A0AAJ1X5P9_9RHOB|nr:MAPEG family protein [Rhodoalgimonas zhirmunskyi]MDQ2094716.1 MAPEG family protein [Rhodoalgimonas zhirmunskyi]
MSTELTMLVLALFLHMALMVLYSIRANRELGSSYPLSPRDKDAPEMSPPLGRLKRAVGNSFESLIMFAPAVVILILADKTSGATSGASVVFVCARLLYIPAYVMGLVPWRSLIWGVGFFATLALLLAALI